MGDEGAKRADLPTTGWVGVWEFCATEDGGLAEKRVGRSFGSSVLLKITDLLKTRCVGVWEFCARARWDCLLSRVGVRGEGARDLMTGGV